MNETLLGAAQHQIPVPRKLHLYWLGMLLLTLGLAGLAISSEAGQLSTGMPFIALLSYKLTGYANVLLGVATALYLAHLYFTQAAVGKWASGLATAGAITLLVALLTRWYESHYVLEEGHVPISNLYEVTVFFAALTTLIYLVLESQSRNRHPGAFVMPIVMAAIAFELWLVSIGQAGPQNLVPALKSYWMHAHVLANFIGYGAFAVACGGGVMYLLRQRAEVIGRQEGWMQRVLPGLDEADTLMYRAIAVGFITFTIATILGAAWAYDAWGGYWSWDPKETWSLIVWLTYAAYLHLRFVKGWAGSRMAWWAILGFGVTLFCFVGVNMYLSGLHTYGKLS